jgi:7,8-dihydropterin-6-yl-methyl-4-(beta-D-ribofuranosyl)aminobenzene 5'-phosphate synthase
MQITVLVDNNSLIDNYLLAEPALSFLIEDNDTRILFDTGYSDVLIKNANALGVKLITDYIVFSHGHEDHSFGLSHLIHLYNDKGLSHSTSLISHPESFKDKIVNNKIASPLINVSLLNEWFDMVLTKEPYWLTDNLVFLGEIPRNNDFEGRIPFTSIVDGKKIRDYTPEDSALVYKTSKGIVIITGCSHAGICNIAEYAKQVCGDERVIDIIGGFHLLNASEQVLQKTSDYLSNLKGMDCIHPCHCTDLQAKIALSKKMNVKEVGVGLTLNYA